MLAQQDNLKSKPLAPKQPSPPSSAEPPKKINLKGTSKPVSKPLALAPKAPAKLRACVLCNKSTDPCMRVVMQFRGPVCSSCYPKPEAAPTLSTSAAAPDVSPAPLAAVDSNKAEPLAIISAATPALLASGQIAEAAEAGKVQLADKMLEEYAEEKKASETMDANKSATPPPPATPPARSPSPVPSASAKSAAPVAPALPPTTTAKPPKDFDILAQILNSDDEDDLIGLAEDEDDSLVPPKIAPKAVDIDTRDTAVVKAAPVVTKAVPVVAPREKAVHAVGDKEKVQASRATSNSPLPRSQPAPPLQRQLGGPTPAISREPPSYNRPRSRSPPRRSRSPPRRSPPRRSRSPLRRSPPRRSRSPLHRSPPRHSRAPQNAQVQREENWHKGQQDYTAQIRRDLERRNVAYLESCEAALHKRYEAQRNELLAWRNDQAAALDKERANMDLFRKQHADTRRRSEQTIADLDEKIAKKREIARTLVESAEMEMHGRFDQQQRSLDAAKRDLDEREKIIAEDRAKLEADRTAASEDRRVAAEKRQQAAERERQVEAREQETARLKKYAAAELAKLIEEQEKTDAAKKQLDQEKESFEKDCVKRRDEIEQHSAARRTELEQLEAFLRTEFEERQAGFNAEKARVQKECDERVRVAKEQAAAAASALVAFTKIAETSAPHFSEAPIDTVDFDRMIRDAHFDDLALARKRPRTNAPSESNPSAPRSVADAVLPLPSAPAPIPSIGTVTVELPPAPPAQLSGTVSSNTTVATPNKGEALPYDQLPLSPCGANAGAQPEISDSDSNDDDDDAADDIDPHLEQHVHAALTDTEEVDKLLKDWESSSLGDLLSFDVMGGDLSANPLLDAQAEMSAVANIPMPPFPPPYEPHTPVVSLGVSPPLIMTAPPQLRHPELLAAYNNQRPLLPAPSGMAAHQARGIQVHASQQPPAPKNRGRPREKPVKGNLIWETYQGPQNADTGSSVRTSGMSTAVQPLIQPCKISDIPQHKKPARKATPPNPTPLPAQRLAMLRNEDEAVRAPTQDFADRLAEQYTHIVDALNSGHQSLRGAVVDASAPVPAPPLMPVETQMKKESVHLQQTLADAPRHVILAMNGADSWNLKRITNQRIKRRKLSAMRRQQRQEEDQEQQAALDSSEVYFDEEDIECDTSVLEGESSAPAPVHGYAATPLTSEILQMFDNQQQQQQIYLCVGDHMNDTTHIVRPDIDTLNYSHSL